MTTPIHGHTYRGRTLCDRCLIETGIRKAGWLQPPVPCPSPRCCAGR